MYVVGSSTYPYLLLPLTLTLAAVRAGSSVLTTLQILPG